MLKDSIDVHRVHVDASHFGLQNSGRFFVIANTDDEQVIAFPCQVNKIHEAFFGDTNCCMTICALLDFMLSHGLVVTDSAVDATPQFGFREQLVLGFEPAVLKRVGWQAMCFSFLSYGHHI